MKKFWIMRDNDTYDDYAIASNKENLINDWISLFQHYCRPEFEKLTGLKLKPGEIVQCELKVIKKG